MQGLEPVVDAIVAGAQRRTPFVVGIGGPVAVGKSTATEALRASLAPSHRKVAVLSTDSFLMSNADLAARDLTMRKGFPESYDTAEIDRVLTSIRAGRRVAVRRYSHLTYDLDGVATDDLDPADVVLIEGIVALQRPVVAFVDLAVYIDAREPDNRAWYVSRFLDLVGAARGDDRSFYRMFTALDEEQVRAVAEATWDNINAPNLRDHIAPSKRNAQVVIEKAGDHAVARITTLDP